MKMRKILLYSYSIILLGVLVSSLCLNIQWVKANPDYEDFTTFTEVEEADYIQTTEQHVDINTSRTETAYLYKNYGVDHFDDFTHLIDAKPVSDGGQNPGTSHYGQLNNFWLLHSDTSLGDEYDLRNDGDNPKFISVDFYRSSTGGAQNIRLKYWDGNALTSDTANFSYVYGTMYYFNITRLVTALTCEIRTENQSGTFKDRLTVVSTSDAFRYLYAGCSLDSGYEDPYYNHMICDIENLDLQEILIYPQHSNVGYSTTLANTSCLFSSNWTADIVNSPPIENMSSWIFGSNMSGTWENVTYPFPPDEELVDTNTYSGATIDHTIFKLHPSVSSYISGLGQCFTVRPSSKDVFSYWNITALRVLLKKSGSPTCNVSAVLGIGSGTYGSNWVLSNDWGNVNSTTVINATTLTTSYVWYWFNFSEPLTVRANEQYGWGIVGWGVGSTVDPSNRVFVDSYGVDTHDGNPIEFFSNSWTQTIRDLRFYIYGVPSNCDVSWANITFSLPAIVGLTIAYEFFANNTNSTGIGGMWSSTGLLFLITTGWNFTFYYTYGGIFRANCETVTNGTTTGYPNGSRLELAALPQNSSYRFMNFTFDASNSLTNPHNITDIQSNLTLWCYFEFIEPWGISLVTGAYGLLAIFILAPITGFVIYVWKKR